METENQNAPSNKRSIDVVTPGSNARVAKERRLSTDLNFEDEHVNSDDNAGMSAQSSFWSRFLVMESLDTTRQLSALSLPSS
jgi:hypothetical protein